MKILMKKNIHNEMKSLDFVSIWPYGSRLIEVHDDTVTW